MKVVLIRYQGYIGQREMNFRSHTGRLQDTNAYLQNDNPNVTLGREMISEINKTVTKRQTPLEHNEKQVFLLNMALNFSRVNKNNEIELWL